MAVVFPAVGFAYDHPTGLIQVPNAHLFNNHFGIMGVANPGGTKDYTIQSLQMLAFALGRRNPAVPDDLDAMLYALTRC